MKRIAASVVLVGVLVAAAAYSLKSRDRTDTSSAAGEVSTSQSTAVRVIRPHRTAHSRTITLTGVVRADRQAAVTVKLPSTITAVYVKAGDRVRTGQPLLQFDGRESAGQLANAEAGIAAAEAQYRKAIDGKRARAVELDSRIAEAHSGLTTALAKLKQAELAILLTESSAGSDADRAAAGVKQAEAGLRQAVSGLAQADDLVKRLRFLYSRGGVARADLEGAETQAEIARAQKDAAIAAVEQAHALQKPASDGVPLRKRVSEADAESARAGVRQAEEGVRFARRARIEAMRVADRDIEAAAALVAQAKTGKTLAAVQGGATTMSSPLDGVVIDVTAQSGEIAQPGPPLVTVVSQASVYVESSLPGRYADRIRAGQTATITVDGLSAGPLHGTISRILPAAGTDSRTLTARITLRDRPTHGVIPGIMARVDLDVSRSVDALFLPTDAVRTEGNQTFVFLVANGKAVRRAVTVGATEGNEVEILSGLSEAADVISSAASSLQPGTPVSVITR